MQCPDFDLTGQVALVTGAGRGIGRDLARAMAACGAHVLAGVRDPAADVAWSAPDGGTVQPILLDVTDVAGTRAAVDIAVAAHGRIDILVNNAGVTRDNLLMRLTEDDFDAVVRTNLKGTFLVTKAVSRQMIRQRCGRIVNMSSVVGEMGNAGQSVYAATKAGILGFTKAMARELASREITVNAIAPGFITTDMTGSLPEAARKEFAERIPLGRFGAPEEVAELALFLASDAAAYVTGQVVGINGGMYM